MNYLLLSSQSTAHKLGRKIHDNSQPFLRKIQLIHQVLTTAAFCNTFTLFFLIFVFEISFVFHFSFLRQWMVVVFVFLLLLVIIRIILVVFFSFNFVCSRVLNRTFNLTNNFATYLFVSWSESSYNIWLTVREDSTLLRAIVERCDSKERKRLKKKKNRLKYFIQT